MSGHSVPSQPYSTKKRVRISHDADFKGARDSTAFRLVQPSEERARLPIAVRRSPVGKQERVTKDKRVLAVVLSLRLSRGSVWTE